MTTRIFCFVLAWLAFSPLLADDNIPGPLLEYLHSELLLSNSEKTLLKLQQLELQLKTPQPAEQLLEQAQPLFRDFIMDWKRVETTFVAGSLDADYLDHPRYIDYYHQGNESIAELLERALNSTQNMSTALFKNSTKSINALEYLLFHKPSAPETAMRQIEGAQLAVGYIKPWIEEIVDFYQSDKRFVNEGKESLNKLVNRLIESSYKLKNWRIGEAGGLVKKYQGKPSATRLEYVHSGLSLDAIQAILQTHKQVIDNDSDQDLQSLGKQLGVETEMNFINRKINEALKSAQTLKKPLAEKLTSEAYVDLFQKLTALHNAYYFMLIDSLGLNSQIIDADGD